MDSKTKEHVTALKDAFPEPKWFSGITIAQSQTEVLTQIGKRLPMVDSREKAMGKAIYYSDLALSGMLHGKILRSPHPHARILNIDVDRAVALPGVRAVIFSKDVPSEKYGVQVADRPILAQDKVRFVGEEVAAVAAIDEETAEEAIDLIRVEYEPLSPVLEVREALQPGSPLVHEEKESNLALSSRIVRGDVGRGFDESEIVVEEEFRTQFVHALYMEPQITVALVDASGRLLLYLPVQTPFTTRDMIARILKIPLHKIKVIQTHMGGAFGGKLDTTLHFVSALLALKTGKPVRLGNSLEEDLSSTSLRVPADIRIKIGASKDGGFIAKQVSILADNGAYCSLAPKIVCTNMAIRSDCLYRYQHTLTESKLVYTNKVPTSAFRGFGNPQITFAQESIIDKLAAELGIDPVQIRLKNGVQTGDRTIHGWRIDSCGLQECLEEGAKRIGWEEKRRQSDSKKLRGVGVAAMIHVSGNRGALEWDGSEAWIRMHEDGTAVLLSGESELGQGKNTVLSQIAAEAIGLSPDQVHVPPVDTETCPFVLGPYSSKTTVLAGNAVRNAGLQLRSQILEVASSMLQVPIHMIRVKEGQVYVDDKSEPSLTVKEVVRFSHTHEDRQTFFARGIFDPGKVRIGPQNDYYGDISATYPFAAHFAEVEVDPETGQVTLLRYVAAHDVGKAINPMAVEGQIRGGVTQGLGYALTEAVLFKSGEVQNANLLDYVLMTSLDVPPIEPILVEPIDPAGPYGAKGIGEATLIPVAAAVANAIYHATGIRFTEIPITPEKIHLALKRKKSV
ncbi:MAG: xanthine dehydrogenase family protein molybdopterin-binding subunit [Syntrophorhabdales bacterium]|jgi:CO/xanthine dehydrogenase Mo-binding subunit